MGWYRISCWPNILHTRNYRHTPVLSLPAFGEFSFHCHLIHPESSSSIFSVDAYSSLSGCLCELPVHISLSISAILSISFRKSTRDRIFINFLSLRLGSFSLEVLQFSVQGLLSIFAMVGVMVVGVLSCSLSRFGRFTRDSGRQKKSTGACQDI